MNMMEEGEITLVFSKTLNSVFNHCAVRLRVALNKQDDLIVSGRYRLDDAAEQVNGAILNFDFKGAELETVAKHKGDGRYEVYANSYIESAVAHHKWPKVKLPAFCVNKYIAKDGCYDDLSKDEALEILAEFDAEMSAADNVTAVENTPRQTQLHYNRHQALKM